MIKHIVSLANEFYSFRKFAKKPSAGFLFFCKEDNTILLGKRGKEMSSAGKYDIFGGRYDDSDDNALETANREAHEELSVLPKNKKLIGRHELPREKDHKSKYIIFIYEISADEKKSWTPKIKLDEETEAVEWYPLDKIPKNTHFDMRWIDSFINSL